MLDVSFSPSVAGTLVRRAAWTPDRTAYVFLGDGEEEQVRLTYAELDARARAIAAALRRSLGPGERALLLDPPGLDFVAAFFGCLYAGVIAVPAYPPRSPRKLPRLLAILADARPAVVLAAGTSLRRMRGWFERSPEAAGLSWLASDELDPAPEGWEPPMPDGDAVAFLQYTSGSTSAPKGVRVTQGNLAHNQRVIQDACGHSEQSVFVSWLPVYHDLGLIGNLLQATWVGAPCVLMAPVAFLQSPARWLRAISRYRGTTSGGPNFAYDLCARRISPAEIEQLDLSSWRVAFNGAEPVREETLARFARTFAPAGFSPGALYPCYGLAEATLMVSGGRPGEESVVREVDGRRLVGCGRVLSDLEVAIVDPETGVSCPPGGVGEIWVAGGSVADGYWNRPAETAETFGARLNDGRGPWLRTGDLGALDVLSGGELFIAGRLKDLIILRGRNHYPQDLEATAGKAHPALADGTCAAFAVDASLDGSVTEERLVIVHETERHADRLDEAAAAIRSGVAEEHEALVYEVVLVGPGGVPRTTSGKVQRRACRHLYLRGELRALGTSRLSPGAAREDPATEAIAEAVVGSLDWLARAFAAAARVDPDRVDPDLPLTASGLDSLAAVELVNAVEAATGVSLSFPDLLEGMTLRDLERQVAAGGLPPVEQLTRTADEAAGDQAGGHPLSWNQRSLWFLHRLAPESPAYNIAGAARLQPSPPGPLSHPHSHPPGRGGTVDPAALGRALQGLVDRHPMLRATFVDTAEGPVQRVAERAEVAFETVDAAGWSDEEVRARLQEAAFRPFDLTAGPLLRSTLLVRGNEAFLVLAVHHIAADFWSMAVLARDLGALYLNEAPPPLSARYTDFARRQQEMLEGAAGEALWGHWRARLAGAPPLELPTDRQRRPVQTLRGGTRRIPPSAERAEAMHRLAAAHGCTPFVALLAAWQTVLSRWSGQEDFLLGAPMAGRSVREWGEVVGYFVNLVPLRADLSGDPATTELMARTRRTTLDALAHQDLPFALLAERLQPERDLSRPPLVSALLTFEKAPAPELAALAAFAAGVPGARLDLQGLTLESHPLDPPAAQVDLSLMAAELPAGLALSLEWDADLFDEATAGRMIGHLDRVLLGMAAAPGRRVGEIDLLTAAELAQINAMAGFTGSPTEYPREATIHRLFEEQAAREPERAAVISGDGTQLTYGELNRQANRLAHHLMALGAAPETPVGVAMERSPRMVVALLGILKAGAAFVPLDPAYPPDRLARMREEVELPFLVTDAFFGGDDEAIAGRSTANPELNPKSWSDPSALAYVMFTSGSTGRPKAVGIPHRAVVRLVRDTNFADLGADQTFLQLAPISFDAATLEIWAPLLNGGRLALFPPGPATPADLGAEIARQGVTTLWLTAGLFHEVVDAGTGFLGPLRQLLAGGDTLSPEHVNRVFAELPACVLINGYGPTENTTFTCCHTVRERVPLGGTVPIGRAVAHTRVELLDARFQRVPPGVPGELLTGGDGLARGYLGRPDLTAERFIPNPFSAGDRLYRTGDRARLRPDGEIEFLGRLDRQVKIRGFRVEPGEVEAALGKCRGIAAAAVLVLGAGSGKRLVAFVAPAEPAAEGPEKLRERLGDELRERLPSFMVPSRLVVLASLPLSPNGKVDRRVLEALVPALPDDAGEEELVSPAGPTEELLAGIWVDLLGRERVGRSDDFFALGGHSLLAMRLSARMGETFGIDIPLARIFGRTTLSDLAAEVDRFRGTEAMREVPPLSRGPRPAEVPPSFAQERLWFLDRLAPGQAVYNIPIAIRLRGRLSVPALAAALAAVAARHEALRTTFPEISGRPVQTISAEPRLPLPLLDLGGLPPAPRGTEALRLGGAGAGRPFDLATGPLCRAALVRLDEEEHLFALDIHHTVFDGGSVGILLRELALLYDAAATGKATALPPPAVQYADFAFWQRDWLESGALDHQLNAWRELLAGAPAALDLPTDWRRPAVQTFRGGAEPVSLSAERVLSLRTLGRRRGATLFMGVLAGWATLLHRASGASEVVVGSPVANRRRPELEGVIGLFVNTLPLRIDLGGDPPFSELLFRVRATALAAYENQDMPFERLVEAMEAGRDLSRSPLFQVMLALQDGDAPTLRLPGVAAEEVPLHNGTAKLDLLLTLAGAGGGLAGGLEFNADLFDAATARRLSGQLARLLDAAAADPEIRIGDLKLLDATEERQILVEWNATEAPYPRDLGLHELFETQARRTPLATALIHGERRLTYAELDAWADRLARRLRALGVGAESLVGVFCGRTPGMVAAALAVLKAGGAYLPLDPAYPEERLRFLLADSGASIVLTEQGLTATLQALPAFTGSLVLVDGDSADSEANSEVGESPRGFLHPDQMAYAIYTSGSTGTPKGVMIRHGGAVARIAWALAAYPPAALAGVLATTSLCFDLSVFEIFVPLAAGGTVVLADDALALRSLPAASEVTLVNTVPSAMTELVRLGALPRSVRAVNLAGEPLRRDLAERIYDQGVAEVHNLYGPSEDTTYSTGARVERGDEREPAIGRPLSNTRVYLLDAGFRPVPLGAPGELWIGGAGVARGYLGRPDLTADRFRPDPFGGAGSRLYRTGDLARRRADGALEYLGRLDHQVKVRGFRIELGEIEAALLAHPRVAQALVIAREIAATQTLVAYVVGEVSRPTPAELREHLRRLLPEPMVPAFFVALSELPLTPNGKVDRRALPDPEREPAPSESREPRTPIEELVAGIWAEVLERDRVGIDENFFDLGGHSLLATRVVARLRSLLGVELPVRALFERPTVAGLAATVEGMEDASRAPAPPFVRLRPGTDLPLSPAQERLWFLDRLEPGNPAYNVPLALRLRGPVSAPALAAALAAVAARHEVLRTRFVETAGRPVLKLASEAAFPLTVVDLTGLAATARPVEAGLLIGRAVRRPFDLAAGPLCRASLLRLDEQEHLLAIDVHHIVFDGGSVAILLREVGFLYAAAVGQTPPTLPALPIQYADFAFWQRAWLDSGSLEGQLEIWRERLAGAPAALDLPLDRPRPPVQTFRGNAEPVSFPAERVRALRTLGRRQGATLFMTVLAGWSALLHRMSGAPEVVVGSPVAHRRQPELEGLIGLLVNTLPLRIDLGDDPPFTELLLRVRAAALAAYENQDVPFEHLVGTMESGRDLSRSPLFQVMLALADSAAPELFLPGTTAEELPLHNGTAKFELLLALATRNGGLVGGLEFNTSLFDPATARRLVERLARLLAEAAAAPSLRIGDLPLLDAAEERQALIEWNGTETPYPRDLGLFELFAAQAARTPRATALIHGERRLTYAELADRAGRLARRLRALGVGPEVLVGVFCGRTPNMVIAALAVLAAGGAYLPLDPAYPADRLRFLLADSGAPVVVVEAGLAAALPAFSGARLLVDDLRDGLEGADPANPANTAPKAARRMRGFVHPEQAAYAIYTSGSTGAPKGVIVRQAGAVARVAWALAAYRPEVLAGVLAATSLCFDLSVFEIFVPLAAGGAVILADDALALPGLPAASAVTLVNTVPSAMTELVRSGGLPRSVRVVNLAGEPLRRDLAERIYAQAVEEVHNLYGPSEDTTYSTGARVERGDLSEPAIGRPLPNTRVYLLDAGFRPVPVGAQGELWIGGAGLARGYLRRPDLTADRFRPDPFGPASGHPAGRLYRTGDLARRRADGTLDYLGRADHQIKIRGFRIEVGEIEAALLACAQVREAVVLALAAGEGKRLVACVTPETAPAGELRRYLGARLPAFMVPAAFLALPGLPLTPNGKVDRRALEQLAADATQESRRDYVAPRNAVEEILAPLWAEILEVERVGALDDFFVLGGHSLAGVRLVSRVSELFGVRLPVRDLFQAPTLEGMAELLAAEMDALAGDDLLAEIDAEVHHGR